MSVRHDWHSILSMRQLTVAGASLDTAYWRRTKLLLATMIYTENSL